MQDAQTVLLSIDGTQHSWTGARRIEPGRVFDRITDLDGVPDGYRAMNEREALKVMIDF